MPRSQDFTVDNPRVSPPNKKGMVDVSAFLRLPEISGLLTIQASKGLLKALSEMPERKVKVCLYRLVSLYGQQEHNRRLTSTHGRNSRSNKNAWTTARVLFPVILEWATNPTSSKTGGYKTIERILKKEGHKTVGPDRIAAYVVRRNIENRGKGKPWPGKDPCVNISTFQRQLAARAPIWNGVCYSSPGHAYQALGDPSGRIDPSRVNISLFVKAVLEGEGVTIHYQPGIIFQYSI